VVKRGIKNMATELRYGRIIDSIADIIRDFDRFLSNVRRVAPTGEAAMLSNQRGRFHEAARDRGELREMLSKLDYEALLEMFKNCYDLAHKYRLPIRRRLPPSRDITIAADGIDTEMFHIEPMSMSVGWDHAIPWASLGYSDEFDGHTKELKFNIHATSLKINDQVTLRLWKGAYWAIGGEIGFYGTPRTLRTGEMRKMIYDMTDRVPADNLTNNVSEGMNNLTRIVPDIENVELDDRLRDFLNTGVPSGNDKMHQLEDYITNKVGILGDDDDELFSTSWGHSLSPEELDDLLGLSATTVQVYYKANDNLITEHHKYTPEFWTTTFTPRPLRLMQEWIGTGDIRDDVYTLNIFHFKTAKYADDFYNSVSDTSNLSSAFYYQFNDREEVKTPIRAGERTVIIRYGGSKEN
jgi:hypothetical protein